MAQKTVLILDDDLGFSMWLGNALNEAGISAIPACRCEEVLAIISDGMFPQIDLIIVNLKIDGCREVLDTLAAQRGGCKIISIGAAGKRAVDGTLRRPRARTPPPPERYIRMVRDVLSR